MYDTLILGAGMSGLAAGIRLAQFEHKVCILEKHTTIGGLNSFYRLDGRNYDVGLHALTNFVPKGTHRGPMSRLLRQLRISWDQLAPVPQLGSAVAFPGRRLRFNNDAALLESEIAREFPGQVDGFRRLCQCLVDYDDWEIEAGRRTARQVLTECIGEPVLREMLLCPLMFYGSATADDMDFASFSTMFRSIFLEGFARPWAGVRPILKTLVRRYKELGGELRLRAGAERLEVVDGRVRAVVLDDGSRLEARNILSSAGWPETMRLCQPPARAEGLAPGDITYVEAIAVLDRQPAELGHRETIVFYNDSERFAYRRPEEMVDCRSGVICSPNNFDYDKPLADGVMRFSCLANFDHWSALDASAYAAAKAQWFDRMLASAARFVPDCRAAVVARDVFTPMTIRRFTGHDAGTVYGAARKRIDGTTQFPNLFLCGNDQGLVGIVGTILSGITVANRHLLKAAGGN